jgi:hypothetical protein
MWCCMRGHVPVCLAEASWQHSSSGSSSLEGTVHQVTYERTMLVAMGAAWMSGVAGKIRSAEIGVNYGTGSIEAHSRNW